MTSSVKTVLSAGKQHDDLKRKTMNKTLEITLKESINTKLPTCDDKGVFLCLIIKGLDHQTQKLYNQINQYLKKSLICYLDVKSVFEFELLDRWIPKDPLFESPYVLTSCLFYCKRLCDTSTVTTTNSSLTPPPSRLFGDISMSSFLG
jgi:hypothetical protein